MTNKNEMGGGFEEVPQNMPEASKENQGIKFEDLPKKQQDRYYDYIKKNPEIPKGKEKRESGQEILELEALFASCEANHPIAEIYLITTEAEALINPARSALKKEIPGILKRLRALDEGSDISNEKRTELWDKYQYLNNASGTINSGRVDHDRHY